MSEFTSNDVPRRTRQQAIDAAGDLAAEQLLARQAMTPREQAEAAWSPTSRLSVDELEDQIRANRGLPPLDRGGDAREDRQ